MVVACHPLFNCHCVLHTGLRQLAKDDCFWAALAEAKWGAAVRDFKPLSDRQQQQQQEQAGPSVDSRHEGTAAHGSWQRYCYKRMSARTIRWGVVLRHRHNACRTVHRTCPAASLTAIRTPILTLVKHAHTGMVGCGEV